MQPYSKTEIQFIRDNMGKMPTYVIAWKLRRKESAVIQKYNNLLKSKFK
jgi:hypothetical protein